ncbi:hypothetical protein KCP76_26425 (plasmid) [Salmonella enterica subsp. enterica serovar Weltevreden]|nr:hypothetical protein KCP76_26425 [Salmonella enterica subsp. enterica serovar Weltevreden]QUI99496.1 hypothetical protein KCP74_25845 [Salmonella enterica subsp. enterica]QUJ01264.1 hypothetical protein KCP73_27170 [Salmonella enterica subsp. enterica]
MPNGRRRLLCVSGGSARYSDLTIRYCLMVRTAYWMPCGARRPDVCLQTMEISPLAVPDHTTVSRRAAVLPPLHTSSQATLRHGDTRPKVYDGQWLEENMGRGPGAIGVNCIWPHSAGHDRRAYVDCVQYHYHSR